MIVCLVGLFVAVIAACQSGTSEPSKAADNTNAAANSSSSAAKPNRETIVNEIKDTLAQHDKALDEKNIDALMAFYSSDPNTVMMGTGAEEKWQGQQEIKAAYTEIVKDYDANTLQCACNWKTGDSDDTGTMAWIAAICDCKDSLKGKARNYKLNVSAAVKKQDGKWKFSMVHMSNAAPPPAPK